METKSRLIEKDREYIWHPFTQMKTERPPIPIVRGKGVYLYSEDDDRYLDGISSWGVNLHGHAHPYIIEKIKTQAEMLEHVMFGGFTHSPAVDFASRLLPILPGRMGKIFYSDNGATAIETALKMALQYWYNKGIPKSKVVSLKNGYHGDTFGAMSAAGKNDFNKPFCKHFFPSESIEAPFSGRESVSLAQLEAILKKGDVACFIFEPLLLSFMGGMSIYPATGLDALLQLCRDYQVLTIADEVMTGFGRTGTLFACDQLMAGPDILCLSKGITGGFLPMGATACTNDIYEAFYSDRLDQAFLHGHSISANPIACASALASLELLLEASCSQQRSMIEKKHREFSEKWKGHHKLKRCENLGVILVLEYHDDRGQYFSSMRDRLYDFFLDRGILLRPLGNVLYVLPPYCIKEEELEFIYDNIIDNLEGSR